MWGLLQGQGNSRTDQSGLKENEMTIIKVGCDPEVFVKQGGKFVSAHGLVPGNKANPFRVKDGAVQVDGMALEFNIDPASNLEGFVQSVQSVFNQLRAMCPDYEVVATPVADFSLDYIASQPAEARELGCDPDFDAYTGNVNEKPNGNLPMRTASGHIHIGWTEGAEPDTEEHDNACRAVALQMDVVLGLGSLFYDDDQKRREMYGRPGCYRRKTYGAEYRTLSNAWLKSEQLMAWVYRNTIAGMERLMSGDALYKKYPDVPEIILNSDKKRAEKIILAEDLEICYG